MNTLYFQFLSHLLNLILITDITEKTHVEAQCKLRAQIFIIKHNISKYNINYGNKEHNRIGKKIT